LCTSDALASHPTALLYALSFPPGVLPFPFSHGTCLFLPSFPPPVTPAPFSIADPQVYTIPLQLITIPLPRLVTTVTFFSLPHYINFCPPACPPLSRDIPLDTAAHFVRFSPPLDQPRPVPRVCTSPPQPRTIAPNLPTLAPQFLVENPLRLTYGHGFGKFLNFCP